MSSCGFPSTLEELAPLYYNSKHPLSLYIHARIHTCTLVSTHSYWKVLPTKSSLGVHLSPTLQVPRLFSFIVASLRNHDTPSKSSTSRKKKETEHPWFSVTSGYSCQSGTLSRPPGVSRAMLVFQEIIRARYKISVSGSARHIIKLWNIYANSKCPTQLVVSP